MSSSKEAAAQTQARRTVIVAGLANIAVAVIKAVAGILTGSSAMLAEAAHSTADTMNQAFLLTSINLGPDHLIVAARVSFVDGIDADEIEDLADQIDRRLAQVLPQTPHVFIDPTQSAPAPAAEVHGPASS